MTRFTILAAATLLAAAACDQPPTAPTSDELRAAAPAAVLNGAPDRRSATGSAHFLTGGEHRTVAFTAIRDADGSVHGQFQMNIHALDVFWHTEVECLTIVGNRAFIGGTVTSSSDARVRVGTKSYFWVEDHGQGADAPPDRVSLVSPNEDQQGLDDFCNLVQNLLPGRDVLRGNVQIR